MALLFIDTSGARCAALVRRPGAADVIVGSDIGRGHDARLARTVESALAEAGAAPRELRRVGVAAGPGSFTGVRVGVAFARGLGLALGVETVGVGVLDALAASVDAEFVAAVEGAGRGDVIWRVYHRGAPRGEPARVTPEAASAAIAAAAGGAPVVLAGAAAPLVVGDGLTDSGVRVFDLARGADLAEALDPVASPAVPFYARPPDAKLPGGVDPWT